jgi:hypothetical protein
MQYPGFIATASGLVVLAGTALAEPVVALGGGVSGFSDDTMRSTTDDGGTWTARVTLGVDTPIGFEASYIGSAQTIDALGLDDEAILVGNGVQGAVRLNAPLANDVTAFLFGGLAWRRYDLVNADVNTSVVRDSDDVGEVPLGIGIGGDVDGLAIDLRAEYSIAFDTDLVPSLNRANSDADMDRWGVNLSLGYAL